MADKIRLSCKPLLPSPYRTLSQSFHNCLPQPNSTGKTDFRNEPRKNRLTNRFRLFQFSVQAPRFSLCVSDNRSVCTRFHKVLYNLRTCQRRMHPRPPYFQSEPRAPLLRDLHRSGKHLYTARSRTANTVPLLPKCEVVLS